MRDEKTTTISVYVKDADFLWSLRQNRKVIPPKKPGRGRESDPRESFAEILSRVLEQWKEAQE